MQYPAQALKHVRFFATKWRGDTAIVTGAFVIISLIRIISSVTLTRLLSPDVFGAVGVLGSITFAVSMVSDVGFQAFVIRHRDGDDSRFRNVIWTIRLGRSIALTLILIALAWPIAAAIDKTELRLPIQVFSLTFLLDGFTSLSLVSAYRHRRLVRLNGLEICATIVQLLLSVIFSLYSPTYWAVIFAMLLTGVVRILLSYVMFPDARQWIAFDRAYTVELMKFARYITGSSIITLALAQTDKLILSRLFSLPTFGLYAIATNLSGVPNSFGSSYAHQLLYPRYAAAWREAPSTLRDYYYATKRVMHCLYMFAVGGLVGSAPLVIEILYDDRYRPASLYLQWLAFGTMFGLSNLAMMNALVAIGKPVVTFQGNIVRLVWLAILMPIAYFTWRPLGIVAVVATVELPAMFYHWYQMRKVGLFSVRGEAEPLAAGGIGMLCGWLSCQILLPYVRLFI